MSRVSPHSQLRQSTYRPKKSRKMVPRPRTAKRRRAFRTCPERSFTSSTYSRPSRRFISLRLKNIFYYKRTAFTFCCNSQSHHQLLPHDHSEERVGEPAG